MRVLFFVTLLLACLAYALLRGGWPERSGVLMLVVASALTFAAGSPLQQRFASVETGVLIVDVGLLIAFLTLALTTDRYWPLWTTALQLLVVLAHLARWADPHMFRVGYGFIMAVWSYLQLLVMALGIRAYHRARLKSAAARY
jgi:hypothetical protein